MGMLTACINLPANMKVLVFCALVASACAWPHLFQSDAATPDAAHRQQAVNHLLYKVTEKLYYDDGHSAQKLVKEMNDHRLTEQHHWFSLFNNRQREEALMLFDVLMHCKTWDCAIHNAAYFREHMNEGEFVYALYTAVVHSPFGKGIVLPPLYEVTPHMYTNSEIIQKAYTAQMTQKPGVFDMS